MGRIQESQLNDARQKYLELLKDGKIESPLPLRKFSPEKTHSKRDGSKTKRESSDQRSWHWAWNHYYIMTTFAFLTGFTLMLLHICDLIFEWPFFGQAKPYDYVAVVCCGLLAWMSFCVYGELPKIRSGSLIGRRRDFEAG